MRQRRRESAWAHRFTIPLALSLEHPQFIWNVTPKTHSPKHINLFISFNHSILGSSIYDIDKNMISLEAFC
jgi:hypothetical protein